MQNVANWELIKFKYEVLGISIDVLAAEHQISKPVLEFNSQSWKQLPLVQQNPINLESLTSIEEILTELGKETSSHTKAFAILKQKFLGPKYVELETVLLHKAIEIATALTIEDPRSATILRSLVTILSDLLAQNPLLVPDGATAEDGEAKEWIVTVVDAASKEKSDDG